MSDEDWYREIHERLLANDPIAPAELAEKLLDKLVRRLTSKYYHLRDTEMIYDAATDALISYIKAPNQFDPSKRGLWGYLQMAAEGDLLNYLAKSKRREQKELLSEDVELTLHGGNIIIGKGIINDSSDVRQGHKKAYKIIDELFSNEKDKKMAMLILQGERSTKEFTRILGVESKSIEKQRQIVKRHKDRLKKRIERHLKGYHE